jgi:hypothetical protein
VGGEREGAATDRPDQGERDWRPPTGGSKKIVENGGSGGRGTSPRERSEDTHVGEKKRALKSNMFFGVEWFRN